ncbi:hypothetical protein EHF_0227 [Ehrlichia japonica]|uniref:Uncharacterized protein n=1 Tax=Ehrlichia japonica TaxID=391036 RepID=X5H2V2_9RICK|nr:hypothetical protein EHF_0227 [Ehrlichia japonica]
MIIYYWYDSIISFIDEIEKCRVFLERLYKDSSSSMKFEVEEFYN